MFQVKVLADSVNPFGDRLTTVVSTYPRFIHAEIMTHRDRARNASSSRAIPFPKMVERVLQDPVIPLKWGTEKKGMQTGEEAGPSSCANAEALWLKARDDAVFNARALASLGIHKSLCNRLLEPFAWITVVMTATSWKNFFQLRCHQDAEYHFRILAERIREEIDRSYPVGFCYGDWHTPFVEPEENLDTETRKKVSVARCARISYVTHGDVSKDVNKDLELFDRLLKGSDFGHWSPFEHVAKADYSETRSGPFRGWVQYRKEFPNECAD